MVAITIQVKYSMSNFRRLMDGLNRIRMKGLYGSNDTRFRDGCKNYWRNNIYNTYNKRKSMGLRVSGQLGEALDIQKDSNRYTFIMKDIYRESGGVLYEYGQFLRRDVGGSPGRYYKIHPVLGFYDKRVKYGYHKGAKNSIRWKSWNDKFTKYIERSLKDAIEIEIKRYV